MELLTPAEGEMALSHAHHVLHEHVALEPYTEPDFSLIFSKKRGVFVTLTKKGDLRGCIGFPHAVMPLREAIREAACSAATGDPRFPPVTPRELSDISVEVTVLTEPELLEVFPADRPGAITVGKHGLIVRGYGRSGLLLPQVPVEWGWNVTEFLDHTCMKAGLPRGCWLESGVQIFTFEGQIFSEKEGSHG
ncbi:TIGR00296 family protein [Methanospirillum sp. J.3.6.1-F.2.7.3]|uniref:Protein KHC33_08515 n=1 Tax=Methanospirillum purgamenti TaxID=2834276 RepID=A0A8E7AW78_9EURY|nr:MULTISPECIES: TIGR00296 family protein [Methanospirillum]MDX8550058.1 TIGR00296 family protein [Methanospirillum hungatei]QVV87424.1 TIGR00296 family protein [Methanospirillum sp. J.3.6.1-F.2.7.3]